MQVFRYHLLQVIQLVVTVLAILGVVNNSEYALKVPGSQNLTQIQEKDSTIIDNETNQPENMEKSDLYNINKLRLS